LCQIVSTLWHFVATLG